VANSLYSTCYKYNMQVENASVLLLLAEIHKVRRPFPGKYHNLFVKVVLTFSLLLAEI
jgi:hypothetical protein